MSRFYQRSIDLIKQSQSNTGAYVACYAFPSYRFCWLRDSSFIAHAMDTAEEYDSASAFFRWAGRTVQKYSYKVDDVKYQITRGLPVGKDDTLHTRYSLEGEEVTVDSTWGNFQIDGYGTWLWALGEHVRMSGDDKILKELAQPIATTLRYLELVWQIPNYDCWEEHPDYLHPYSLATVYAGFQTVNGLIAAGKMKPMQVNVGYLADQVKELILNRGVKNGRLVKYFCPSESNAEMKLTPYDNVDASLLGVSIPYGVLEPNDPVVLETVKQIETELWRPKGGVYRYKTDVYYGGGEWLLLAAWLGWYYVSVNRLDEARELCDWIESCADENGFFAEQVSDHVLYPEHFEPWLKKWGPVAKPLTWSHAMYVILINKIKEGIG